MKTVEFVRYVKELGDIDDIDEALLASRATLETLAERLKGNEPSELAAQLPPEIAEFLCGADAGKGERFSPEQFVQRVSDREGVDAETAMRHTQAVLQVLTEAVDQGEIDDVRAQLPLDYQLLFGAADWPTRH